MMTTVLVTGGAGYIGSIFVEELIQLGFRTIVLDNLYYDNQTSLNHLMHNNLLEIRRGDVRKPSDIDPLLKRADYIFPLAALVGQLLFLESENSDADITMFINSPGGSVTAGMAIYDTMQFIVTGKQIGRAHV